MDLLGYSGARGTLIYEKNLKPKISCQTPFKQFNHQNVYCDSTTRISCRLRLSYACTVLDPKDPKPYSEYGSGF